MLLYYSKYRQYFYNFEFSNFLQNYIARFGHGSAKLARQAQSKEKTLAKMVAGGLAEKVVADKTLSFSFPSCGTIPPPVIMVFDTKITFLVQIKIKFLIFRSRMLVFDTMRARPGFIETWSSELTWILGWLLSGPTGQARVRC
jgi:hypothetical protein